MKFLLSLIFCLSSFSAMAMTEILCEGEFEQKSFRLEIEEAFPQGSRTRDARLTVISDGAETEQRYWIHQVRGWANYQTRYTGAGITFEFNHWPDPRPRWGRTYNDSVLRVSEFGNRELRNVSCRFLGFN